MVPQGEQGALQAALQVIDSQGLNIEQIKSSKLKQGLNIEKTKSLIEARPAQTKSLESTSKLQISPCLVFVVSKGFKTVGISRGTDVSTTIPGQ